MLTQEEIKTLDSLNKRFIKNCRRVLHFLKETFMDKCLEENAEIFTIDDDKVIFYGWDRGGECFKYDFPSEYLSLSNNELLSVVERINRERKEAELKAKIQKEEFDKNQRFILYKKLKDEFGE